MRAQTTLEYLLLVGGVILIGAIVLAIVSQLVSQQEQVTKYRVTDSLCAPLRFSDCSNRDPDGPGELGTKACKWTGTQQSGQCTGCTNYDKNANTCT